MPYDRNRKNILNLDSREAIDFFLKSEQYHGFELLEYFVFDDLLQSVKDAITDTPYGKFLLYSKIARQIFIY